MPTLFLNGVPVSVPAGLRPERRAAPRGRHPPALCRAGALRQMPGGRHRSPHSRALREDLANHVPSCLLHLFIGGRLCHHRKSGQRPHPAGHGAGNSRLPPARPRPPGYTRLGAAIDLGTTTLAARLYDETGRLLTQGGCPNPQSHFGADVIARIQASIDGEGETLARCVSEGLTGLLSSLCGKAGAAPN